MTKNLKGILKTCVSPTLNCPLEQDSTFLPNGSSNLTVATSLASQPTTDCKMLPISSPSTPPLSHQMTHQLDQSPSGSAGCLQGLMLSSSSWLNALDKWTIGALLQTSSTTANTMKNIRKSMQKSTGSSWMSLLLSKIVPYVNNALKHQGALKVLLTLKGWAPSLPVPSGAHTSPRTKITTMSKPSPGAIAVGINSKEEVMKQPSGLVMEHD
jgi:hypothetical protein